MVQILFIYPIMSRSRHKKWPWLRISYSDGFQKQCLIKYLSKDLNVLLNLAQRSVNHTYRWWSPAERNHQSQAIQLIPLCQRHSRVIQTPVHWLNVLLFQQISTGNSKVNRLFRFKSFSFLILRNMSRSFKADYMYHFFFFFVSLRNTSACSMNEVNKLC